MVREKWDVVFSLVTGRMVKAKAKSQDGDRGVGGVKGPGLGDVVWMNLPLDSLQVLGERCHR